MLTVDATKTNEWFTTYFINYAEDAIASEFLNTEKVNMFCRRHKIDQSKKERTVGVICAGNIPLVGFGDMFYSLLCGWNVLLKPSSKDPLMRIFDKLPRVSVVDSVESLSGVDAVILMGSDATCKTIDRLFPNTPKLLRGAMHSVAVLDDRSLTNGAQGLFNDMFLYCSMGCRSVSHIYLPEGFDTDNFAKTITLAKEKSQWDFPSIWYDNYRYQRALMSARGENFVDLGFALLSSSESNSVTNIRYSTSPSPINIDPHSVQHIATTSNFGRAQHPTLDDFSGGISVPDFLLRSY